eukprot:TRINITY_DN11718_c0_g3_i1.p2 TRINITY_DN11718_c0_g3~~TRINITY_DN11718_c0_g3_i1.p2  ORF type:complete len:169 (+),score=49.15 TRINITY_DN11718_c0_g3_i1:88-594(+)
MGCNLDDAQIAEIFDLFDANNSGSIDSEELGMVMEALGLPALSDDERRAMIADVDVDNSGTIDLSEFKLLVQRRAPERDSEEEVAAAFSLFAGNERDGEAKAFITADDIARVARSLGEQVDASALKKFECIVSAVQTEHSEFGSSGGINIMQWKRVMEEARKDKFAPQ